MEGKKEGGAEGKGRDGREEGMCAAWLSEVLFRPGKIVRGFNLTQVCILVKSFHPYDAYLYRDWHVRCANKPYSLDQESLADFETHFTVACYDPNPAIREEQVPSPSPVPAVLHFSKAVILAYYDPAPAIRIDQVPAFALRYLRLF